MAVNWRVEVNEQDRFLDFFRYTKSNVAITFYLMIETMEGKPTPVPSPLQCKNTNDRVAELIVSISRNSDHAAKRTPALVNAYSKVDLPPNTRAKEDFQRALQQIRDAGLDINTLKAELIAIKNGAFHTQIQGLYDEYARVVYNKMLRVFASQKELLKGTLKDKDFVYYPMISFNGISHPHVIVIGTKNKEFEIFAIGECVVGKILKKGTELISRNKYFQYSGNVGTQEMFYALKNTGWNMKNIVSKDNLEKK